MLDTVCENNASNRQQTSSNCWNIQFPYQFYLLFGRHPQIMYVLRLITLSDKLGGFECCLPHKICSCDRTCHSSSGQNCRRVVRNELLCSLGELHEAKHWFSNSTLRTHALLPSGEYTSIHQEDTWHSRLSG